MDIYLALLADAATVDASGKLNILGVFDRLGSDSFPARHPRMALVLRFSAGLHETGVHSVEILLLDPDGGEMARMEGEMQLGAGPSSVLEGVRVPHVLYLDGLVFPRPGRYAFDVSVDGQHHRTVPLVVSGPGVGVSAEA
jgi:hypothetical protein